jgi:hypothetical protein
MKKQEGELIRVNELLGKQPSIGLLPANQILPIAIIIIACYAVVKGIFGLGLIWIGLISLWLIATWLLLTGKDPDQYVNKFRKPIHRNWTIGGTLYISPLSTGKYRSRLKSQLLQEKNRKLK